MAQFAFNATGISDFNAVRLVVASPEDILKWSHGEVTKPETINYRTQKPERDGLFCERIFGPVKDINPHDSKLKGVRSREAAVDKNGELVTKSIVRRERMGHIQLAVPVAHIWFMRGTPSAMSQLLGMTVRNIEKIVYFATYVILNVDEATRDQYLADLEAETDLARKAIKIRYEKMAEEDGADVKQLAKEQSCEVEELEEAYVGKKSQLESLNRGALISESEYRNLPEEYDELIEVGMGASAVKELLDKIELPKLIAELTEEAETAKGQRQKKLLKRLKMLESMESAGIKPSSLCMTVLPVIPPDLRPMVALSGGRFATSDLNDLYRRIINRNNRLKKLIELNAPEVIQRNEKRMLQEAVDALIDNSASRGRAVSSSGGRRSLKSLSDMLKGKQGRFRQNLLGKRVDYSGRSVIVVDPHLKLHQCGLPSAMALELFKPFVMRRLVELRKVENIKGAKRAIDRGTPVVWDVLDEVIQDRLVLLNRAPTLHRLSIQAFEPVLIEGKAIHLHPLVCAPFNADFDGDQMSVHVPLSTQAQTEARILMLSSNNLRSPASGKVLTVPSQDMVFGVYYLTSEKTGEDAKTLTFASFEDALLAIEANRDLDLQAKVVVRVSSKDANVADSDRAIFRVMTGRGQYEDLDVTEGTKRFETTVGRIIFNRQCLPEDYPYINYKMVKSDIGILVNDCCDRYPMADVEPILDNIKKTGFHYATLAGLTVSVWDAVIPPHKPQLLQEAQDRVDQINEYYEDGFLSERERHVEVVNAWTECTDLLGSEMLTGFAENNPIYMMADSGARGSKTQLRQLAGMRGLMADMSGETIDLPIKANFREGLEPLEYFISTYGARKGLVDTASHTSDSGYLTRRLVDVAQDVIVREEDCGTDEAVTYPLIKPGQTSVDTDLIGRCTLEDVCDPNTGEVLIPAGGYVESKQDLERLVEHGLAKVQLRALLTCKSKYGVCQKCYGWDLSTRRPVNIGTAVGIIAAQSIGEPGTQLTMRTIHSGGVAGADDITQGLPTVARMFDVVGNVNEKILGREADLAPVSGVLHITPETTEYLLRIVDADDASRVIEEWRVPASVRFMPGIEDGVVVRAGDQITRGFVNFRMLRRLTDIESTMHTFVESVKDVYTSQGVELNDKHIEVIARQMLRRVQVTNPGDSSYLLGQYVDRYVFAETVQNIALAGGTPPEAEPAILGTLKVASSIDSWLSSASFIRTAGVLTSAAIEGDVDHLLDLKSNVIVGKQIPAGTGLSAYSDVELTYHGTKIDGPTSSLAKSLPDWAPAELKDIEEQLPKQLDWVNEDYNGGVYSKNGRTLSSEDAKLYLFDDLGVSQRWTNKFSEVGIETVGDLIGKTEEDLLRIDGIGAKAIEELRDGLEARNLLYILEPEEDEADSEDLSQLLNMVFSPEGDGGLMLGSAAPSTHSDYTETLIGSSSDEVSPDVINEDLGSLDDLLNQVVRMDAEADGEDE